MSYELTDENQVIIRYKHQATKACPVNLTNHTYFNLAGEGSEKTALDHALTIYSDCYLPTDKAGIPSGEWRMSLVVILIFAKANSLAVTFYKITTKFLLGDMTTFMLDTARIDGRQTVASLSAPEGDVKMNISTTMPSMQLYTGII